MRAPRTLTARLVATAVLLVAVVSILIATVTAVAVRAQQMDQLDKNVLSSVRRADDGDRDGDNGGPRGGKPPPANQGPGTLLAFIPAAGSSITPIGGVLTEEYGQDRQLSSTDFSRLRDVPADGKVHGVSSPRSAPTGSP